MCNTSLITGLLLTRNHIIRACHSSFLWRTDGNMEHTSNEQIQYADRWAGKWSESITRLRTLHFALQSLGKINSRVGRVSAPVEPVINGLTKAPSVPCGARCTVAWLFVNSAATGHLFVSSRRLLERSLTPETGMKKTVYCIDNEEHRSVSILVNQERNERRRRACRTHLDGARHPAVTEFPLKIDRWRKLNRCKFSEQRAVI